MPPTIKSLEERIDDLADDMVAVKNQLAALAAQTAVVVGNQNTTQTQLAVLVVKIDAIANDYQATQARLDATSAKLDTVNTDAVAFRSRADALVGIGRWIAAFVAGAFLTTIGSGFWVAREAGRLENRVEQQQKTLDDIRRDVDVIKTKVK